MGGTVPWLGPWTIRIENRAEWQYASASASWPGIQGDQLPQASTPGTFLWWMDYNLEHSAKINPWLPYKLLWVEYFITAIGKDIKSERFNTIFNDQTKLIICLRLNQSFFLCYSQQANIIIPPTITPPNYTISTPERWSMTGESKLSSSLFPVTVQILSLLTKPLMLIYSFLFSF